MRYYAHKDMFYLEVNDTTNNYRQRKKLWCSIINFVLSQNN